VVEEVLLTLQVPPRLTVDKQEQVIHLQLVLLKVIQVVLGVLNLLLAHIQQEEAVEQAQ
tara:strand:+ start:334 stop:510 length:177 start_codon:yes stop_codon:yes gene_type:complete